MPETMTKHLADMTFGEAQALAPDLKFAEFVVFQSLAQKARDARASLPGVTFGNDDDEVTEFDIQAVLPSLTNILGHSADYATAERFIVEILRPSLKHITAERDALTRQVQTLTGADEGRPYRCGAFEVATGEQCVLESDHAWDHIMPRMLLANHQCKPDAPAVGGAVQHDSDCARHNGPALPVGPCDCSVSQATGDVCANCMTPRSDNLQGALGMPCKRCGCSWYMQGEALSTPAATDTVRARDGR